MKKIAVPGIAALVAMSVTAPAIANTTQVDESTVSVSYADLNIHNDAGARVLYARLKNASAAVCNVDSYLELGSLARVADTEACYSATLDEAVAEIESDALRKIHSS